MLRRCAFRGRHVEALDAANVSGQSVARRPPRQDLRLVGVCLRSYITSGLPQRALSSRSSGEDMPSLSADAIGGLGRVFSQAILAPDERGRPAFTRAGAEDDEVRAAGAAVVSREGQELERHLGID